MNYDDQNVFARILRREIPAELLHEDEVCVAFRDIAPQAPTHFLVIPRQPITGLGAAAASDQSMLGHLLWVATAVARKLGVDDSFRVVLNHGASASQSVFHLHVHVLAGREFQWPPG